jgi:hypothetical protein
MNQTAAMLTTEGGLLDKPSEFGNSIAALHNEGVDIVMTEAKRITAEESNKGKRAASDGGGAAVPLAVRYQAWYSKTLPVIRQLLPDRYAEFTELYKSGKRKDIDYLSYTISDYLLRLRVTFGGEERFNHANAFIVKFGQQLAILRSAADRLHSRVSDIEGVLQAELFRHELEAAEDLLRKGHKRAAGAVAGVSLEAHLARVVANHALSLKGKKRSISIYNDSLRQADVTDIPKWRLIQRLCDIRNLCDHPMEREPTEEEVRDLVEGTRKIQQTVI